MKLFWPVRIEDGAYIGQRFGEHLLDYSQFGCIGHPGVDFLLKNPVGKPIYAPHSGFIERVNNDPSSSLGNYVIFWFEDGGQWDLSLGHMQRTVFPTINVGFSKRYPIKAGQLLGYVGSTGYSTAPHTHLALRQFDKEILLNTNNGYQGCLDCMPYLAGENEKPFMNQFKTQNYKGELRIVLQASSIPEWDSLCKIYGVDPTHFDETVT